MNGSEPSRPFGDEHALGEPTDAEREAARQQVDHLVRLRRDPAYLAEFVTRLQARRAKSAAVQLESVATDAGAVFVAERSFLMRRDDVNVDRTAILREFGLTVVDTDQRGELVRIESDPTAQRENGDITTPQLADKLRSRGLPVDVNHIVPLGVIMKAEGGPEPTVRSRPFPAVTYSTIGTAPLVAVIDTGISIEHRTDGYLQNLLLPDNLDPLDGFPPPNNGLLDAAAGHGSFVAGVVQQVAPTARIHVYKVADSDGGCTDERVAACIRQAVSDGANIINLSLGTSTADGNPPPAMQGALVEVNALHPEVLVVAAAGNSGDEVPVWPAAFAPTWPGPTIPNVVSVAGFDPGSHRSDWSSRGPWVMCSTIGRGLLSTYVIGTEDGPLINDPTPDTYGPNSWAIWTGTSFAAPQITGGVARLCHEKGHLPAVALAELLAGAPTDEPGWGRRVTILPGT